MDEMRRRSPNSPATHRLPPIIWSRLYDELDPYLTWRDADGTATMSFFHRQLADIIAGDVLGGDDRQARHARLADYFDARPATVGPTATVDLRRRSELPWHLAASARWDRFVDVVCDFAFLDAGVRTAGPQAVIDDLDLALDGDDVRVALPAEALDVPTTLRGAIRLSAHVLARDHAAARCAVDRADRPRRQPLARQDPRRRPHATLARDASAGGSHPRRAWRRPDRHPSRPRECRSQHRHHARRAPWCVGIGRWDAAHLGPRSSGRAVRHPRRPRRGLVRGGDA